MKDCQRNAILAKSYRAIGGSQEVLLEWARLPKDDAAVVGGFLQKAAGLTGALSADDLRAMSSLVQTDLKSRVEAVNSQDDVANHVGGFTMMQQR
ncbi:MAG TPA: hypothetical protein VMW12_04055 [Candidatus Dormibacteraeota bacterium]|nr:hypothetical protein [Candidatus Dormibacteraeota bacterium]